MSRRVVLVVTAIAAFAVMATPALAAKGGNSAAAKACQKGAWQTLSGSGDPGAGFASQDACVSYAANGGAIVPLQTAAYPAAKQACEDAGYIYDEPGGTFFSDPIHFTCGDGNGLTVDQAWEVVNNYTYPFCIGVLNAWSTVKSDTWPDGVGEFPGRDTPVWYATCYGSLSA